MRTEQLTKCLKPLQKVEEIVWYQFGRFKPPLPKWLIADRSNVVHILCFSVLLVIDASFDAIFAYLVCRY